MQDEYCVCAYAPVECCVDVRSEAAPMMAGTKDTEV